ncbi:MAG TPA: hypothetical protein VFM70_00005 [Salinimicrobium sp.]|nr:hypothetical protein [Salinimicrobium sp.]
MKQPVNMKTCFVIMPISDNPNYENGHFNRVYEHLIKPACDLAKFKPIRADDILSTNHIALDIIRKIIESDMALCDLSSRNPNVLYELGIRQAFNKPVTLIKDSKTKRIFDIQGFRDLEYDEILRIDNVQDSIDLLAEAITSTYEQDDSEINSLIKLLGITPAKIEKETKISTDTELILNSLSSLEKRVGNFEDMERRKDFLKKRGFYNSSNFNQDNNLRQTIFDDDFMSVKELAELNKDDLVYHQRFGEGKIIRIEKDPDNPKNLKGDILFESGPKRLLLSIAQLKKVL